nr:uncharacterized protein LOC113830230 [Penaeus vannamei]
MKFLILACVAAVAVAAPSTVMGFLLLSLAKKSLLPRPAMGLLVLTPAKRSSSCQSSRTTASTRNDGTFNFDFEAANGIRFSQAGSPDGDDDAVIKAGEYSYTAPDGTEVMSNI